MRAMLPRGELGVISMLPLCRSTTLRAMYSPSPAPAFEWALLPRVPLSKIRGSRAAARIRRGHGGENP